jgi:hypothetical protein
MTSAMIYKLKVRSSPGIESFNRTQKREAEMPNPTQRISSLIPTHLFVIT